jgi:transposase-like protein
MDQALDVLIAKSGHSPEAIMGDQGLLAQLTKRLVERVLGAELTHHLKTGRSPTEAVLDEQGESAELDGNCRNGFSAKTVIGDSGEMEINVPRDRHSSFEPLLVPKWQKKLPGFEDKIIALYARGMTVRDIKAMLEQQYRIEVSPDFISSVTAAVLADSAHHSAEHEEHLNKLKAQEFLMRKATRGHPLGQAQQQTNHSISRMRVSVEQMGPD